MTVDLGDHRPAPLAGVSVVVTRPRHQAGDLAAALDAAGARVVALPVVEIAEPEDGGAALDRALGALRGYEWVVFTSANAVQRTLDRLRDAGTLGAVDVAAVGKATAAALAAYHVMADLVPERPDAVGLAAAFPCATGPGQRVLFPAAAGARPALAAGVRAKGWVVDEVVAYRTVPAPAPPPAALALLEAAEVVTFASPSAVDAYLGMRVEGRPLPVPSVVACIGPVTAAAARAAGLTVGVEAESPSAGALVDALVRRLAPPGAP